jgi:hypothetical protein
MADEDGSPPPSSGRARGPAHRLREVQRVRQTERQRGGRAPDLGLAAAVRARVSNQAERVVQGDDVGVLHHGTDARTILLVSQGTCPRTILLSSILVSSLAV